jgi:phosphopantetheinyl transferase (holo-ACP synthase)
VAVALHKEYSVGVDIELVGTKILKLYRRFLGSDEIDNLDKNCETVAMLLHWSAKESFYKIVGNRGGSYAANFSVSPFMVGESGSFSISYTADGRLIKKLPVTYIVGGDYVFTLCVDEEE